MNLLKKNLKIKIDENTKKIKHIDISEVDNFTYNRGKEFTTGAFKIMKKVGRNYRDMNLEDIFPASSELTEDEKRNVDNFINVFRNDRGYKKIFDTDSLVTRVYKKNDLKVVLIVSDDVTAAKGRRYPDKLNFDNISSILDNGVFHYSRRGFKDYRAVFIQSDFARALSLFDDYDEEYLKEKKGLEKLRMIVLKNNEIADNINNIINELKKGNEVARAFETKKNIPDDIRKMMEETSLNNYFSFIEIDEDVDLEKFKIIEDRIKSLPEKITKRVNVELRFKKLGKHNSSKKVVSGMYFPTKKAICIEVKNTTSFIHELAHAIDYSNGVFSAYSNDVMLESFIRRISDRLKENNVTNLAYYTIPTEIFARAFEVWFKSNYPDIKDIAKDEFDSDIYCYNDDDIKEFNDILSKIL